MTFKRSLAYEVRVLDDKQRMRLLYNQAGMHSSVCGL